MALPAEQAFVRAVAAAEGVSQAAYAAAFAAWGFQVGAPYTAYLAALVAADNANFNAVTAAMNASGLLLGNSGQSGPVGGNVGTIST